MPSSSSVHEQLTDILERVVGCRADAVVPNAVLKELGTDSLTIVEIGEELGRRFGVYLSDDTIDSMRTVKDAINAVVRHDGSQPPVRAPRAPAFVEVSKHPASEVIALNEEVRLERRSRAKGFAARFVFLGLVIGAVFGIGAAALVSASGINDVSLPPISAPSTAAPTATSAAPTTPTPTSTTGEPQPTIEASSTSVSPGEKFTLEGTFPASKEGENLQVQVKDEGSDWDDFPIQTKTRDGGAFKTELYTSRTGKREFRVTNTDTKVSSPSVSVEIG